MSKEIRGEKEVCLGVCLCVCLCVCDGERKKRRQINSEEKLSVLNENACVCVWPG